MVYPAAFPRTSAVNGRASKTMRGLYLDGFSGVSGDMLLGALVDLGVEITHLRNELRRLPVKGWEIAARRVTRAHLGATKVDVEIGRGRQPERNLREIRRIVMGSRLSGAVQGRAMKAFERLAKAEARVHRMPVDRVHLHEVGAVDAIVDVVGTMIGLEALGWPRIVCSPLQVGSGTVTMEHGTFPVPPPAVAELLRGRPCYATHVEGELVTPTGAALATTLATGFGPLPSMRLQKVNYNLGEEIGWQDLTREVARAWRSLPPSERARAVVLTENYGEAGAIDRYGGRLGLPRAYSGHNSFWSWGPPEPSVGTTIAIGFDRSALTPYFGRCALSARVHNADDVDNDEEGKPIWMCTGQRAPWPQIWEHFKHYG